MSLPHAFHDRPHSPPPLEHPQPLSSVLSSSTSAYGVLVLILAFHALQYFDYPLLPASELLWNILVYLAPSRVISALDARSELGTPRGKKVGRGVTPSERHATKSEAMRRILGLDGAGVLTTVQRARSLSGLGIFLNRPHGNPPGLGNWDNSCYQNSVIQGLASLPSLPSFLGRATEAEEPHSTKAALKEILSKLNDPSSAGTLLWTPAGLKSMSSWQQQDAQEYFSKVVDEVERETLKVVKSKSNQAGLAFVAELELQTSTIKADIANERPEVHDIASSNKALGIYQLPDELQSMVSRSPLEGLLAQRVGCLTCGYVEGLSLIPFNCLTVPLGKQWMYDVRTCLDEYTSLEPINGVECAKCTLLHNRKQLERLRYQFYNQDTSDPNPLAPPSSTGLLSSIESRLAAVNVALDTDDFSDNTIAKKCQIPARSRISTTKSRQAVIARAPQSLVIHVNRSVFNDFSGVQSKNLAEVQFPLRFDLASWCLGNLPSKSVDTAGIENWVLDPSISMLPTEADTDTLNGKEAYELCAVITHYGRHENGHYICYRRHPRTSEPLVGPSDPWWRFSDDEVSQVSEENVLSQGGVFMLFYEKSKAQQPRTCDMAASEQNLSNGKLEQVQACSLPANTAVDFEVSQKAILTDDSASTAAKTKTPPDAPEIPTVERISEKCIELPAVPCPPINDALATSPVSELSHSPSPSPATPPLSHIPHQTSTLPPLPPSSHSTDPSPPPPQPNTTKPPAPLIEPSTSQDKELLPRKLTPPPMRTAGPRSGRGSVGRGSKGMGMGRGGGMVEAN